MPRQTLLQFGVLLVAALACLLIAVAEPGKKGYVPDSVRRQIAAQREGRAERWNQGESENEARRSGPVVAATLSPDWDRDKGWLTYAQIQAGMAGLATTADDTSGEATTSPPGEGPNEAGVAMSEADRTGLANPGQPGAGLAASDPEDGVPELDRADADPASGAADPTGSGPGEVGSVPSVAESEPGAAESGRRTGSGLARGPRARDPLARSRPTQDPVLENLPDIRTAAEDDGSPVASGQGGLVGFIRQPDGTGVVGMSVQLRQLGESEVTASTVTTTDGRYEFRDLPAERYKLDIGPEVSPIAYAPDRLRLDPGENRYDLRTPRLGGLRAQVFDASGEQVVAGAQVIVKEEFGRRWENLTDADGRAEFPNLPVSDYRILVMRDGRRVAEVRRMLFAKHTAEVELQLPAPVAMESSEAGR